MKENDYFLNQVYNLEFTPGDFATVGLNSSNTTIQDKSVYKDLDIIKNNPMFQTNGKFDEKKFDIVYDKAMFGFKQMSETASNEKLASSYSAFRDDIFADKSQKKQESETYITKIANPNKQTLGFVNSNIMEAPTMSVREIAQSQMTWNGQKWIEAPNDTWFDNFFNPKVLAQWDFDADINGIATSDPSKVVYHKGEKKINPLTGTYYYETLNGRSIYGRDVLSGWDTFTRDGSAINKYDFFDSDDIEKSGTGSLLKSVVKVAPALIPQISPWYIVARLALSMSDLTGKVIKMTTGSDNSIASWLEGFNAAWTQSTSDYARGSSEYGIEGHPWSLENILNLGADVVTQLAEQRWVFQYGQALRSGKLGYSEKAQKAFKEEKTREWLAKFGAEGKIAEDESMIDMYLASASEAQALLESQVKSSQKLGEHLSKLYMTGIVAADSYSEAKQAGLNDEEAAIFTLVYALGEYGILNTGLGEHILPELRAQRRRTENMLKALAEAPERSSGDTRKWYQKIFKTVGNAISKDSNDIEVSKALKSGNTTKAIAQVIGTNALAEGLEEVSEEFWLDLAKSLYNGASNLGITSTNKTMEAFDGGDLSKIANRYALNFTGGLLGGAIAYKLPGFSSGIKNMLGTNMSRHQAYQELVAQIRNGQKNEILKTIDKLEISDSNQAASKEGQGTPDDNLNKANKDLLKGMVNMVDNLLNTNGVSIDDSSILKRLSEPARGLLKFQALLGNEEKEGSTILSTYVQRFNTLATDILDVSSKIKALEEKDGDQTPKLTSEQQQELSNLQSQLKILQEQRDAYLNGDMAKIVFPKVLFELSASISTPYIATNFKEYVQKVEHRVLSEIPEDRLAQLKQEWEYYKSGGAYADDFQQVYGYFDLINRNFSDKLNEFNLRFFQNPQDVQQGIGNIFLQAETQLNGLSNPIDVQQGATEYFQTGTIANHPRNQRNILALQQLISLLPNQFYKDEIQILANIPDSVSALKEQVGEDTFNNEYVPALQAAASNYRVGDGTFDPNAENADSQMRKIRDKAIRILAVDILTNPKNVDNVKQILNNISYMNQSVKDFLLAPNGFLSEFIIFDENNDYRYDIMENYDEDQDEYKEQFAIINLLKEYGDIIRNKPNSPIDELADQFQLVIGDNSIPISEIIKTLDAQVKSLANKNKIEQFGYEDNIQQSIKHAQQVIQLLSSHILASRKDGAKLGNLFGFNSMLNKINPDTKLVEIDKEVADTLMTDLAKLKSKLDTFSNIFNINSGQKLVEQKQIKSRIDFNYINKVKNLLAVLPEEWIGREELSQVIKDSNIFSQMSSQTSDSKYNLNDEDRGKLQKESILVQDAIYEFFQKNKDKDLSSIFDKLVLLPSSSEISKSANGTLIDSKLDDFDDRSFIYLLASSAAVKTSDFYQLFKNSIDPKYAPIPGQELATKMAFSFLMNQPLFEKFGKAFNEKILKELPGVDAKHYREIYGKYISKDSRLDNSYALQFMHTFLVEGIPGAGKSTGFYQVLINMLKSYKPELLKNVWIIHTSEEKADKLGNDLGLENVKAFSKESYLTYISDGYKVPIYKNGVIQENRENLSEDPTTGLNYFKDVNIKQDIDYPTLIIFDESPRFSQQEMLLSEKFQSEYGIHGIATGDYDQIGAVGQIDLGNNVKLYLNTSQDNFFHSPKLGSSMRTDNKIKDENISNFREKKSQIIQELRSGNQYFDKINLKYYQDNEGIFGEKVVDNISDEDITLMLSTLKEGEKLVLISDDPNSELYKRLSEINTKNELFKGKIEFQSSSVSQGSESQYYIVDLPLIDINKADTSNDGNHEQFVNTLYTAISRSKQGTLILKNRNIEKIVSNIRVSDLVKSPLSEQAILDYNSEFVNSLSDITGDINNINYVPISTKRIVKKEKIQQENPTNEAPTDEEAEIANRGRKYPIVNDNPVEYNMFLHSMPVSETGFERDNNGNYKISNPEAYQYRIDGLNGLTKLPQIKIEKDGKQISITTLSERVLGFNSDGTLKDQKNILNILNSITQTGLYLDDREKIKEEIIKTLQLNLSSEEIGIDYLYQIKSYDNSFVSSKGKFNRMFKSLKETLIGIFRGKSITEPIIEEAGQNKFFSLNVYYVKDGKRINFLTVPLTIFTSPLTMMESEDFSELKKVFINKANKNQERMIDLLQNDDEVKKLPNAQKLLKSFLIYTYKNWNGDVVVYMPEDFTLAGSSKALSGPNITVSDSKGHSYFYTDKFRYNGEYVELKDIDQSVHHISKDIYYTPEDVVNTNGEVIIKKGHRFVLISDYGNYRSDQDMIRAFNESELKGKSKGIVSVVYVSGPKVSVVDFFKNFALKYKGATREESQIDTSIGNEFTEYRICEFITKQNSPFDQYIKSITENSSEKTSLLARWKIFQNIIAQIQEDMKSMTPLQQAELLKKTTKFGTSKYLDLITIDDSAPTNVKNIIDNLRNRYKSSDISIKAFISNQLCYFVLKNNQGLPDNINWLDNGKLNVSGYTSDNISKVFESLPDAWKEGIFTQLESRGEGSEIVVGDNVFIPIKSTNYISDTESIQEGNRAIRINGKIDTTTHIVDVNPLMDLILEVINNPTKKSEQLKWYVEDSRKHTSTSPLKSKKITISKELKEKFDGENIENIINMYESEFKDQDFEQEDILLKILNKIGYGIEYNISSKNSIVKIPKNSQQIQGTNIIKDSSGKFTTTKAEKVILPILIEELNRLNPNIIIDENTLEINDLLVSDSLINEVVEYVKEQLKGDESLNQLEEIIDYIQNFLQDPDISNIWARTLENSDVKTLEEKIVVDIETIKDYIQSKNAKDKKGKFLNPELQEENILQILLGMQNINLAEIGQNSTDEIRVKIQQLNKIIKQIDELADNYIDNNSCKFNI